jgi:hypothetical protein
MAILVGGVHDVDGDAIHAVDGGEALRGLGAGASLAASAAMLDSGLLLLSIGCLGAFDVFFFHLRQARITERRDARAEAWIHVARGIVYTLQFAIVPNVKLCGAWYAAFAALFGVDAGIAIADVLVEPDTRRSVGGLPRGEYPAHIVLSVLVGALLYSLAHHTIGWASEPTAIMWAPSMPAVLRAALAVLGAGCLATTLDDVARIVTQEPPPVHVAVRLAAPLAEVWRRPRPSPAPDAGPSVLADRHARRPDHDWHRDALREVDLRHGDPRFRAIQAAQTDAAVDVRVLVRGPAVADPSGRPVALHRGGRRRRVPHVVHLRGAGLPAACSIGFVIRRWFQRETESSFARLRRVPATRARRRAAAASRRSWLVA